MGQAVSVQLMAALPVRPIAICAHLLFCTDQKHAVATPKKKKSIAVAFFPSLFFFHLIINITCFAKLELLAGKALIIIKSIVWIHSVRFKSN